MCFDSTAAHPRSRQQVAVFLASQPSALRHIGRPPSLPPQVYNQVMVGLYIMQLTMLGLLSIKKFKFSPFLIPLIVASLGCHFSTLQLYSRPWCVRFPPTHQPA